MPSPIQRLSSTVADPSAPAFIAAVLIVEAGPLLDAGGRLRQAEIRGRMERRLSRLPQLKRHAHFPGPWQGRPVWVDDAEFAIERHVRGGTVDPPGDEGELLAAAERILCEPLDRAHPPWEIWFLTGLADGRLAVLLKLHHAIADGLGAVAIASVLCDLTPDALDPPPLPWMPASPPSRRALLADNLASKASALGSALRLLIHPRRLASLASGLRRTIAMSSQAPATSFNLPVPVGSSSQVRVLHTELEEVRAIAHAAGAKVNDVLLDVAAGGLRELLLGRGDSVDGIRLAAMVLVARRPLGEAGELGNRAGFIVVPLPVGEPDAGRRLRWIAAATQRAKAEQRANYSQAVGALSVVSSRLFPALMAHQRFINLIETNVPGPTLPVYILGARVLDVIPLVGGLLGGNVTVCFCALSYAGRLNLTVIADATIIPDVDLVLSGMESTWHALERERVASV